MHISAAHSSLMLGIHVFAMPPGAINETNSLLGQKVGQNLETRSPRLCGLVELLWSKTNSSSVIG